MIDYSTFYTDVLVVGGGGAGLRAAIEIAQHGVDVTLVAKEVLGAAHTCMAEGGLNVALTAVNPFNSPHIHYQDTLNGGAGLNNRKLVRVFTEEIPARVQDLESFGVIFDRSADGKIAQRYSGKQTHAHTIFVGDYTGQAIMDGLVAQARKLGIRYFDEHFACNLLTVREQVCAALTLDINTGAFRVIRAKSILLATGGGGRMYKITTNARSNTADGYAIALRLGCELVDMEMVQFHPTGMVYPPSARGRLVTESVRGEGGRLLNTQGERFMQNYYPERMELAGRDEVARSIYSEVQAGRGTARGGVYLDVAHLPADVIEKRLPHMLNQFLTVGVDIRKAPMEVHPTMHHLMGGICIDESGKTDISGLFAAGEVTGGVHGGNRLGGNAVAECQVFGRRAALSTIEFAQEQKHFAEPSATAITHECERVLQFMQAGAQSISPVEIAEQLRDTMWENVGIVRDEPGLLNAKARLERLDQDFRYVRTSVKTPAHNTELFHCLELANMLTVASAIVEAALMRQESRGAHFRHDFPNSSVEWGSFNLRVRQLNGAFACRKTPIIQDV